MNFPLAGSMPTSALGDSSPEAHCAHVAQRHGGYFPHVDGLRCLAIASVVAYHAKFTAVPGGFVGVDVFFVISGFLIIGGLDREVRGRGIRFGAFYFRRVRRLVPALIPMLSFVLFAGAALYTPTDLKTLAASAVATLFFAANVFFYSKASYFEESSETRPLLHAWSLGIEEQFYIFVPFIIWALWRLFRQRYIYAIAMLLVCSLAAAIVTMNYSPTAAFYLMPQRAWEFLAGGMVGVVAPQASTPKWVRELIGALGLGCVLLAVFTYSANVSFPGATALLPVAGTTASIWADLNARTTAGRLLSLRPLAWLGGLSYALYLWHWPILVYGRFLAVDDASVATRAGLVALAVTMAWFSTRIIEDRAQRHFSAGRPKQLVAPAICATAIVLTVAAALFASGGWPARRPAGDWHLAERETWANPDRETCFTGTSAAATARTIADIRAGRVCRMGVPGPHIQYLLWGDSHAEAIRPAFDIAGRRLGLTGAFVGEGGCPPIPGINDLSRGTDFHCGATNQAVLDLIAREHIKLVIMHSRWVGVFAPEFVVHDAGGHLIHGSDHTTMTEALLRAINNLAAHGVTAAVVGAMPEPGFDVPGAIVGPACCRRNPRTYYSRAEWVQRAASINAVIGPALVRRGVPYVDPLRLYCSNAVCPANRGRVPLFYDYRHVSHDGAEAFGGAATRLLKATEEKHGSLTTQQ